MVLLKGVLTDKLELLHWSSVNKKQSDLKKKQSDSSFSYVPTVHYTPNIQHKFWKQYFTSKPRKSSIQPFNNIY